MNYPPLSSIQIEGGFWGRWQIVNQQTTIPAMYKQMASTGRIEAFKLNWKPGMPNPPHIFWDSDVAKWIEAASYTLVTHPNPSLEALLDEVIALIAGAQQPDGYLNTHYTVVEPGKRWTNLRERHELYCAGHLIEAGVAHFQATGKRTLLEVVMRFADHIASAFGPGPQQKHGYPGHEEIELALFKLYHATSEKRYFELARYFVEERGKQPYYYDLEARERGEDPADYHFKTHEYTQSHLPIRQQPTAVGHCVRAMYFYSGAADLAKETDDASLKQALDRLYGSVLRQMYLTGGIGPSRFNEGFSRDYDLDNESAYAETCASVGLFLWMQRMLLLDLDGRYADTAERALYNGALSGLSLDGTHFFYENPLQISRPREKAYRAPHHRQDWFDCACCPANISRLIAQLGSFIYSTDEESIAVHHYIQGRARLKVAGTPLTLEQETNYPWEGRGRLVLSLEQPATFTLKLRIPGCCRGPVLSLNGREVENTPVKGYIGLEREWKDGDELILDLDMPVHTVYADPRVTADLGKVALQRGPLVYCLEGVDNAGALDDLALPRSATLEARLEPDLLGGVVTIQGDALRVFHEPFECSEPFPYGDARPSQGLYMTEPPVYAHTHFKAVPYFTWDNRQEGDMAVWIREVW
jgi:DUF1680 family protein